MEATVNVPPEVIYFISVASAVVVEKTVSFVANIVKDIVIGTADIINTVANSIVGDIEERTTADGKKEYVLSSDDGNEVVWDDQGNCYKGCDYLKELILARFTGSDRLTTDQQKLLDQFFALTERDPSKPDGAAYMLSYAGGNSGLSFGGNQLDIAGNSAAARLFLDILTNAKDENGNSYFTDKELERIIGGMTTKAQSPISVFGNDLLAKINNALSSPYGRNAIDANYPTALNDAMFKIETDVLPRITNPSAIGFFNTDIGKAILIDINNQMPIKRVSKLINYINGLQVTNYTTKDPLTLDTSRGFTINDYIDYMQGTKEYYDHPAAMQKRIDDVVGIYNNYVKTNGMEI